MTERALLKLSGALLIGGLVVKRIATLDHPGLNNHNYPVVFAKYANSHPWIAVHFIQFAGLLLMLGALLVLYRLLQVRGLVPALAAIAAGAAIAAAAAWAVLQGVDGVTQKYSTDAHGQRLRR